MHFARFALVACAMCFALTASADRPPVRLVDPVSQPPNRKAFEDRVNELSRAMTAIDGGTPDAAIPVRKSGKVTIPSSGAWTEVYKFAPGNSKKGAAAVFIHAETDAPSAVTIHERIDYETSMSGTVFLLGPVGYADNAGGPGVPGTPAAPGAMVSPTSIALTWAAVTPAVERGWQVQVSLDAGVSWSNVGNRFYDRKTLAATFSGLAGAMAAVKFRVRGWNGFGFSAWSALTSATTGASHTSDLIPYSLIEFVPVPVTEIVFDDLEMGHFYGIERRGSTGGSGDLIIQAIGSTNQVLIRAKTANMKTGTVRYILDIPPA